MKEVIELIKTLPTTACSPGSDKLTEAKSNNDLFDLYFERIDFCLANNYPEKEYLKKLDGYNEAGIIIDRKLVFKNRYRLAILGKSDVEIDFSDCAVSRLYVKHDSYLIVRAKDNAFVVIDALDNAQVYVRCYDNARVIVNLYSNAECSGATKINVKNRETYEL